MNRLPLILAVALLALAGNVVSAASDSGMQHAAAQRVADGSDVQQQPQQRRELWSIWSFMSAEVFICHGPLGKRNRDMGRCTDDDGSDGDGQTESATGLSDGTYETADGEVVTVVNSVAYAEDGTVVENFAADNYEERNSGGNAAMGKVGSDFNFWFLATIASTLAAFAAITVGQRKGFNSNHHGMHGAVAKRNVKVSTFANEAFAPDSEKKLMEMSSFEVEPGTVTEMNESGEIETRPGYKIV